MYKVLIAEDELLTRAGIVSSVNWAELNMQIVAQADDGMQALQLYREHYPEIVITDLNMPRLGGVELIGKICEEEHPCKIIVITSVEDVQVITRLFPYRIFDFLLKTAISPEGLREKLALAGRELALEGVASGMASGVQSDEQLLQMYLDGAGEADLPFSVSPYWLLFGLHIQGGNKAILSRAVRDLLAEYFQNYSETIVNCRSDMEFVACFKNSAISETDLLQRIQLFCKYVYKAFGQQLLCDIERCDAPGEIRERRDAFFRLGSHVRGEPGVMKDQAAFLSDYVSNIPALYEINTFCGKTRRLYSQTLARPVERTIRQGKPSFYEYRQTVVSGLEAFNRELSLFAPEEMAGHVQGILDEESYEGVYLLCRKLLDSRRDLLCRAGYGYDEIQQSLLYIQANRGGKITLNDVAEQVSFSPSYFSTLFKRAMGISFSNYLTLYRIEHAMELLEDESVFLYEIAETTGIGDISHFSKTFKAVTGYSPNAWRKMLHSGIRPSSADR